jgi:hypothetical protein
MRTALATVTFVALLASNWPARADDPPARRQREDATTQSTTKHAYLGVEVSPVPAALSSQLPNLLAEGQGVLIERVAKDSPAAKAGLQANDILLSYNQQKIGSPEQLITMVRGDTPGREVTIGFVRGGKSQTGVVNLGEREAPRMRERQRVFRLRPDEGLRRLFEDRESNNDGQIWESFDALKLTRIDPSRWRAEIAYRTNDGKKVNRTFEGTREDIGKDIRAEKDLPEAERSHLLRALNLHEPIFEFHFPPAGPTGPGSSDHP